MIRPGMFTGENQIYEKLSRIYHQVNNLNIIGSYIQGIDI